MFRFIDRYDAWHQQAVRSESEATRLLAAILFAGWCVLWLLGFFAVLFVTAWLVSLFI